MSAQTFFNLCAQAFTPSLCVASGWFAFHALVQSDAGLFLDVVHAAETFAGGTLALQLGCSYIYGIRTLGIRADAPVLDAHQLASSVASVGTLAAGLHSQHTWQSRSDRCRATSVAVALYQCGTLLCSVASLVVLALLHHRRLVILRPALGTSLAVHHSTDIRAGMLHRRLCVAVGVVAGLLLLLLSQHPGGSQVHPRSHSESPLLCLSIPGCTAAALGARAAAAAAGAASAPGRLGHISLLATGRALTRAGLLRHASTRARVALCGCLTAAPAGGCCAAFLRAGGAGARRAHAPCTCGACWDQAHVHVACVGTRQHKAEALPSNPNMRLPAHDCRHHTAAGPGTGQRGLQYGCRGRAQQHPVQGLHMYVYPQSSGGRAQRTL